MSAFKNKRVLKILDHYKNIWALSYASSVAHWDLETYMPSKGAATRGEALAKVGSIRQKLFLDKKFVSLIHEAEHENNLTDQEKGVVRILLNALKVYEKVPGEFLEKFEKLTNTASVIWREAKEKDNFKLFEKPLTMIFEMNRQFADYMGYKDSPYDALLDQYEEGLTASSVQSFFDEIKTPLENLLGKIEKSPKYITHHPLESVKYDRNKMEEVNRKVLKTFWSDFERFRLDVSAHPFTTSFGRDDVRITTRYKDAGFSATLLGVVHEFGHALYDLQSSPELEMSPVAGGSSLVIHESQSRFWENFVGTSEPFITHFLKDFEGATGKNLSPEDVYLYFNEVAPSAVRVDADEVTYHFHIMLRFEIEKGLIEGKMKVSDLPEIWNSRMKEYLGVTPKNDAEGVLQDVHWSGGMVGYFPTYSLGTFLSAQWNEEIIQNSNLKNQNYNSKLKTMENWLQEHVHKYGSTYTLQDLLKKNGMTFDPKVNIRHLEEKYSKLYNF